jgi:hypothetical protein
LTWQQITDAQPEVYYLQHGRPTGRDLSASCLRQLMK